MMPDNEQRKLKLIKGARSGLSSRTRMMTRRTVTRRVPATETSVTALLSRLDEEPTRLTGSTGLVSDEPGAGDAVDTSRDDTIGTERNGDPGPAEAGKRAPAQTVVPGATRHRRLSDLLLLAVLAVALAAAGLFGQRWYTAHALAEAHQQAVAAARQTTVNFVSISAASVDRDLQRITEGATGEFKEEFTRGMPQVRAAVTENKVESSGSVLRAGLVTGDLRTAVVLVAVDATVKNTNAPKGRASHYRIQVDLTKDRQSGAWLVSRLQFVG